MTHPLTHDGRPARYRVQYADGGLIPGQAADSLFSSLGGALVFVLEAWAEQPADEQENLVVVEIDDDGVEVHRVPVPTLTRVSGLGAFVACQGDAGGFVLYSPVEWRNYENADYEADAEGRITFQGQPTGYRLTSEQMDAAR